MEFIGFWIGGWMWLVIFSIIVNGNKNENTHFTWPITMVFGWLWPMLVVIIILNTLANWRDRLGGK